MRQCYITTIDRIDAQYHRSHVIIHKDYQWHFADMDNMNQLQELSNKLGFTFELIEERKFFNGGNYCKYSMSHNINSPCDGGFWQLSELPTDAKPIKALSNGSIVTCYFTNDGETIRIYRPNPNAMNVYRPLSTPEHIEHCKTHGTY